MIFKLKILYYLIQLYLNETRFRNRKSLALYQQRLFGKLTRSLKDSQFYNHLLKTGAKLSDFPIISKSDFMDNFNEINTVGIDKDKAFHLANRAEEDRDFSSTIQGVTVGLSSGTSGNKGLFLVSKNERARWVAAILHRVIGVSLKKRKIAFFLRANSNLYESVKSRLLSFTFFDTLKSEEDNFDELVKLNPDILIGQPSVLVGIAGFYKKAGLKPGVSQVISVAEVLDPIDKSYLEGVFKQNVKQVYQCTEGFLAFTCKKGNLHFNEDFIILERGFIKGTNRYNPIITDLFRRSQPVIRYKLDDLIIEGDSCPCGSVFRTIQRIEGRSDDTLVFNGSDGKSINVYPDFIRRQIILSSDKIIDYAVRQFGPKQLAVYIKTEDLYQQEIIFEVVKSRLTTFLKSLSITGIEISTLTEFGLKRGIKLRRIRNEYQGQH